MQGARRKGFALVLESMRSTPFPTDPNRLQARLLFLAGVFLFLFSAALTLSPVARARSWQVNYRWDHWLGTVSWAVLWFIAHRQSVRLMPERDPYLLPIAALLSGWGVLTIWRLTPSYGFRQTIWLSLSLIALIYGMRLPTELSFLRRFKYLWLTAGLLLTALALLFGANPMGGGLPRLWLGCCGIYFQPSEPLKLLLIVYLAAYLAGKPAGGVIPQSAGKGLSLLSLLAPTLIMTGLALLLLVFQRDLGTASIFLFLYALVVYIASGQKRILILAIAVLLLAGVTGSLLFDVVRLRIDAWLNPWLDASGRSYQVVQSLLAIANGGMFGRGPGLGSPTLVPVSHSDFIFVAIAEETGLLGAVGLLLLIALLVNRGLRASIFAPDAYRRYLAAGLTVYLAAQSLFIIGGNLRLLPLTGVTLPFVSYGGSSLLTSFFTLTLLLHVSSAAYGAANAPREVNELPAGRLAALRSVAGFLWVGLALAAGLAGWWALYRAPDLLERTDNARRAIADRYALRGSLLDRNNDHLMATIGRPGEYYRYSLYPDLSPVTGYTHPIYGQSGLEATLDPYLRGLRGNPSLTIWWNSLLYGLPPPGLDVRLSLDLPLQRTADDLLRNHRGAMVVLDASNGDILVMASHPNFDPNRLDQDWADLAQDERAPLLNRATLGQYQPGASLAPLFLAAFYEQYGPGATLPTLPQELEYNLETPEFKERLQCAVQMVSPTWEAAISSGCPTAVLALARAMEEGADWRDPDSRSGDFAAGEPLISFFNSLGLYTAPEIQLPTASSPVPAQLSDRIRAVLGQENLRVSPLQMALAVATLSSDGIRPAPRLVVSVDTPAAGWVVLPYLSEPTLVFSKEAARVASLALSVEKSVPDSALNAGSLLPIWQSVALTPNGSQGMVTWYLAGTLPDWKGTPLALALLIEEDNPALAVHIGQSLIQVAIHFSDTQVR